MNVKENQDLFFDCEIGGVPTPKITWTKKGEELVENESTKLINDANNNKYGVNIKTTQADAGVYTLLAANKIGKVTLKTEVTILGNFNFKILIYFLKLKYFNLISNSCSKIHTKNSGHTSC